MWGAHDLPGFGQSNHLASLSLDETADLVAELIGTLPSQRTHVVGLSYGASVVIALLERHPDGQPQSSLVLVDYDGECAMINTTLERQKGRNLLANPKVSLLVVDPDNTARFVQTRGDAELVFADAVDHLDELTRSYTRRPAYYGFIHPIDQRECETRTIVRIHAQRTTLDAIHA